MIAVKFAFKNLMAAGLRTWLNVFVLSLSFVLIIWLQGLYEGMGQFASRAMTEYDIGGGQYWHQNFDPFDPLNMEKMHGLIPAELQHLIARGLATPQLLHPATIFPHGRMQSVRIRGIDPEQQILKIPSQVLKEQYGLIPTLIGQRFAQKLNAQEGDLLTIRWRDANGTFDAVDVEITKIM
ncbi:ABC transporter permease, partial [candidate division KSB1 bacterium]